MEFTSFLTVKLFFSFLIISLVPSVGIVFYFLKNDLRTNLIDKLIISIISSPLVLVFISFAEDMAGIPQNAFVLSANLAILAVIDILLLKKFASKDDFPLKISWKKALIYAFFFLVILARVLPTTQVYTPITADPIAHGEWLRTLNTTFHTTAEFWYPQGIEYYLNYFATFATPIYPKLILIFTNLFSSLFPISFFYFSLITLRNMKRPLVLAFVVFIVASLVPFPKNAYFTFGKNASVFALALTPLLLMLIDKADNLKKFIILSLLTFSLVIFHYPTAVLVYCIIGIFFAYKIFHLGNRRLTSDKKNLVRSCVFVLITLIFSAILFFHIKPIYEINPATEDKGMTNAAKSITNPFETVLVGFWQTQKQDYQYPICRPINEAFGKNTCRKFGFDKDETWLNFFFLLPLGLLSFVFFNRKEKTILKMILGLIAILASAIILILIDKLSGIFLYVQVLLFSSIFFVLFSSLFIYNILLMIKKQKIVLVCVLALIGAFVYGNIEAASTYLKKQKKSSVVAEDIAAFDYINENIARDGQKILIELYNVDDMIIAGADSGIFITTYTGHPIEVSWLNFGDDKSFDIYKLFKNIVTNPNDRESLAQLSCKYDIGYFFAGSKNQRKSATIRFEEGSYYEKIFDNGARIYELKNLKCQ